MFPSRYFADRYFAPRYFPKVGEDAVNTPGTVEIGWSFSVPTTTLHFEVPPTIEMSFSVPSDLLHFDSPTR